MSQLKRTGRIDDGPFVEAVNNALLMARHRIVALEQILKDAPAQAYTRSVELALAKSNDGPSDVIDTLNEEINRLRALEADGRAEKTRIEGSLQSMTIRVGALGTAVANTESHYRDREYAQALAAWVAIVKANESAARRLKEAVIRCGRDSTAEHNSFVCDFDAPMVGGLPVDLS
jgi:hypothetical protein